MTLASPAVACPFGPLLQLAFRRSMSRMRRAAALFLGVAVAAATLVPATSAATAAVAAAPTLASFSPTSGKLGSTVTLTGSGFTSPATVTFGGVAATSVTVSSATRIVTKVPFTAPTGPIRVTTAGGSATSAAVFTVTPGVLPTPAVGPPTATTTVRLSGLSPFELVDEYFDTTEVALVTTDGNGSASASLTVPRTASPGPHWITVVGRRSGYAAQAAFTVRSDWAGFGYSTSRYGRNPYENVLSASTVGGLQQSWGVSGYTSSYGAPAVVAGIAYDSFLDGTLRAFTETTGALRWTATTGGQIVSSPWVAGGVVYVGSDDHYLYAFDAATGALKWRFLTGDVVRSSPVVANGRVYVGSFDDKLYAIDASTGAAAWSFAAGSTVFSSPAVAGGEVYVGSADGNVYALDAATGALTWSYTTGAAVYAGPVVVNGHVYVGSTDKTMYSLRATSGALDWSYLAGGALEATAGYGNGALYFGGDDGVVYAVDAASGALRWSASVGAGAVQQRVAVANGVVYTGSYNRTYALAGTYGGVLATMPVGTFYGGPAVVNGAVVLSDFVTGSVARYTVDPAPAARPLPGRLRPTIRPAAG